MRVVEWNVPRDELIRVSLKSEGAVRSKGGAIVVTTGKCTGRSPDAKSIVCDSLTEASIDWKNNRPATRQAFLDAKQTAVDYLNKRVQYRQHLYAGFDEEHRIKLMVITEHAWQGLFASNMFIKPDDTRAEKLAFTQPDWTLYCAPSAIDVPTVMIDFTHKEVVIMGTHYAGEIKKSIFTALNFLLPEKGVLPMHCSVNTSLKGDNPAVFFGLSGTGKTTLSSDVNRLLVGDDEHGWSNTGLFNFEGGCYAKVINLCRDSEPQIWEASQREGAILENVILNPDGTPDFSNGSHTENTRASYDLSLIDNTLESGQCGHPKNVVFLTCDAFGVLPPVSKLTPEEASEHFTMGYTAKVAGTEAGITEPVATFSHCFGAPFMPLPVESYAQLLREKIEEHNVDCWLVNTGWSGGPYGTGSRMPIEVSREVVNRIIDGRMSKEKFEIHEHTQLQIPSITSGLLSEYVRPETTWDDVDEYQTAAQALLDLFKSNS